MTATAQPLEMDVRRWNARTCEWVTVTVEASPEPRRRARKRAHGPARPLVLDDVSGSSPLPSWWRDTAYAPTTGWADTRTFIKPSAMRTHGAPVVTWDGFDVTSRKRSGRPEDAGADTAIVAAGFAALAETSKPRRTRRTTRRK
jgi:hypothetical protein